MLGAIAGDVIGSVHEHLATKSTDFELFAPAARFTDDTVLTVAVADCLLHGRDYVDAFHQYFNEYPNAGYGFRFFQWASAGSREPYNSYGNGSAMRVSAVGHAFNSLDLVLRHAAQSAEVTHNHPEGVKGAQATAAAIFMARQGDTKSAIIQRMRDQENRGPGAPPQPQHFVAHQQPCLRIQRPERLVEQNEAWLQHEGTGDADTLACIAGGIAEAHYGGVPREIADRTLAILDERLRATVQEFRARY